MMKMYWRRINSRTLSVLTVVATVGFTGGFATLSTANASTLCPSQATPGGFGNTITSVSGPLDGTCGANSAVKIDIADSTSYGKPQFRSSMPGFPAGLTLGGLGAASANVAFTTQGSDQPYFLLPFIDGSNSLRQASATDQILLIEFQPTTLAGNTLGLDPAATMIIRQAYTYRAANPIQTHWMDGSACSRYSRASSCRASGSPKA